MNKLTAFGLGVASALLGLHVLAKLSQIATVVVVLKPPTEEVKDAEEEDEEQQALPLEDTAPAAISHESGQKVPLQQAINFALRDAMLLTQHTHGRISTAVRAAQKADPFDEEAFEAAAEADELVHAMLAGITSGHLNATIPPGGTISGFIIFKQFRDAHLTMCQPSPEARNVFWTAAQESLDAAKEGLKLERLASSFEDAPRL